MQRRDFLKATAIGAGALAAPLSFQCSTKVPHVSLLPKGAPPKKLFWLDVKESDWHKKTSLTCLQGLINKEETRLYLNFFEQDKFWLDHYEKKFGIEIEPLTNVAELYTRFAAEISGYVLYDPNMPHTLNIATTIGGLLNCIPVSKHLEEEFQQFNLNKMDDLCGRWANLHDAYEWAIEKFLPQCNQKLIAQLCVHNPFWPTSTFLNRDYVIANKAFSFDLSTSERDKKDYNMVRKIYEQIEPGAVVIGWHCVRDKEHEAIALSSEFGHLGMCSLHTANLTVHSTIPVERKKFKQRKISPKDLEVEDKVYIAYMATDGDAAWFMLDHVVKDWASPAHGKIKYNWGFLPLAYDLAPATVQYYMQNALPEDYFVAGPAGATYTYPYLHPDPERYLKLSADYMEKCGLTTVHITNWNDRDWWQEVDLPEFPELLRKTMPNAVGFVRGMGESAFEQHYIEGGKPYIFCGEGIHRGDDIYKVMSEFIDACPNRPLFVYNLVNHSVPMHEVKAAMDRFSADKVELVHLDELLMLVEKAYAQGKISQELYPEKEGLKKILAKEARAGWPALKEGVKKLWKQASFGEKSYVEKLRQSPIGLETINAGEILAFSVIWNAMSVVKRALEMKGIYVNHKPTATQDFLKEYSCLQDIVLIADLQNLWDAWHRTSINFETAQNYSMRLNKLVERLDEQL